MYRRGCVKIVAWGVMALLLPRVDGSIPKEQQSEGKSVMSRTPQPPADLARLLSTVLRILPGNETGGCVPGCQDALKSCLDDKVPGNDGKAWPAKLQPAIDQMMMKRTKRMRRGIYHLASSMLTLSNAAAANCAESIPGLSVLSDCAGTLKTLTERKGQVDYKAMEKLKVSGVDIHRPLNEVIGWYQKDPRLGKWVVEEFALKLGEVLGLFKDVVAKEEEVQEKVESEEL